MSFEPTVEEQQLLVDTIRLRGTTLSTRERVGELLVAGGFLIAAALIWWLRPPVGSVQLGPCLLCSGVMVLATLVCFDTPFGFTVATQLAFVPLLFVVPLALVPLVVLAVLALESLLQVARGALRPSRVLCGIGNSWFSIGAVLPFVLAGTAPRHAGPALLATALLVQFAVDAAISTARLMSAREASLIQQLRDGWVYVIDAALAIPGLFVAEAIHRTPIAVLGTIPILGLLAMFARERSDRLRSVLELSNAYRGTAYVLGDVVEADDGYTGEHCKSVVSLALAVADELSLSAARRRNLEFGALLHDVGKIAIPKEIINKPGKLDPLEWTIIKTHTIEGQKMLDRVGGFMHDVGMIVRSHHERWDGGGYPDGLAGEEIPLESRIISCCDTWNAMRTDRSYREALSVDAAMTELRSVSGQQLDPRIVEVLAAIVMPAEPAELTTEQVPCTLIDPITDDDRPALTV